MNAVATPSKWAFVSKQLVQRVAIFYAIFATALTGMYLTDRHTAMFIMLAYIGVMCYFAHKITLGITEPDVSLHPTVQAEVREFRAKKRRESVVTAGFFPAFAFIFLADWYDGKFGLQNFAGVACIHAVYIWSLTEKQRNAK